MVVAHLVRKSSQIGTPFIALQIQNLKNYIPAIIYKYDSGENLGYAPFDRTGFPILNLSDKKKLQLNFYYLKKISSSDSKRSIDFLKKTQAKIVHLHFGTDAFIYSDVMAKSGLPSVVSFYGHDIAFFPNLPFGIGRWYLKTGVFKYATKILAMSQDMKYDLIKAGCPPEKILVHYYGVRTDLFKKILINYNPKPVVRLLIIANLVPKKGHIFILKALKKLKDSGISSFTLDIMGSGSLENDLKNFSEKAGLNGHVKFLGSAKFASEKMISGLKNADIFIHPSVIAPNGDKEGIPGTIVEAMAAGLPVVSTYHAGIPYVIENEKTGLLVNEWDVEALANAIKRLMGDHLLRKKLGEAAKAYACEYLDLIKKEQELEAIYDSLVNQ